MNIPPEKKLLPKVCILAAGAGTRMESYSGNLNKGLLPTDKGAIINKIISYFGSDYEFVIACGYKAKQVKDFLALSHPNYKIEYVDVENYQDSGSGPGTSLKACQKALNGHSFYLLVNDGIFLSDLKDEIDKNWLSYSKVKEELISNYSTLVINDDKTLLHINAKSEILLSDLAFTGIAFIKDYDLFWKYLIQNPDQQTTDVHFLPTIQKMADQRLIKAKEIEWIDLGQKQMYEDYLNSFGEFNFSKTDEFIYFFENKIIKFFKDEDVVNKRVQKSKLASSLFPNHIVKAGQFYSYEKVKGTTLYKNDDLQTFTNFLIWTKNHLWKKVAVDSKTIEEVSYSFYREKSIARLKAFRRKYPLWKVRCVNGVRVDQPEVILNKINWNLIFNCLPVFMHGDLQPDNVIVCEEKNGFKLIDWRHEFAGHIDWGDVYYDLAKLMGGLYLNYFQIKMQGVEYLQKSETEVEIGIKQALWSQERIQLFEDFIIENRYSIEKIRLLVPLIYLNMAPLHAEPLDKYLMSLSQFLFTQAGCLVDI